MSANLWHGANKTIGAQVTGGAIIHEKISIGAGIGIGSRNYEYFTIPVELGIALWQGNRALRIYGGPTYEIYRSGSETGFLAGTEVVFRPRFDMRNLKLFLALGVAFDKSFPYGAYFDPFGPIGPGYESTVLPGPRFRIGFAL